MASISTARIAALAGIFVLGLSSASMYEHRATAATEHHPPFSRLVPGQVQETEPPATVVATAHYQTEIPLSCGTFSNFSCVGDFLAPGNKKRLNVTRIACLLEADAGSTLDYGVAQLVTSTESRVLDEALPVDSTSSGYQVINRAVDIQVSAHRHIFVYLQVSSSTPVFAFCTATGTLDTLG